MLKNTFFLLLILAISANNFASDLRIRGQVKGLTADDRKAVPVVLSDVNVTIAIEGSSAVTKRTNLAGVYIIELKRDKRYLITVSREGYNRKSVWISTHNLPWLENNDVVELTDLDFLLLKSDVFPDDVSLKEDLGQLAFNVDKSEFQLNVNNDYRHKKEGHDNSLRYMRKIITYVESIEEKKRKDEEAQRVKRGIDGKEKKELVTFQEVVAINNKSVKDIESATEMDVTHIASLEEISQTRTIIDSAKAELEKLKTHVQTKEDTLQIQRLEALIKAAETNLMYAEATIRNQEERIANQNKMIAIYTSALILLILVAGIIFWLYREKNRTSLELAEKNEMIMDGIHYANTIQTSFLKSEKEIKELIPGAVLLFRPRDIVSGDIYWVSEVDRKIVIAAIDCTGHGVPGAFISMIANTLLNEIVNNKKILDPGRILGELHKGVMDVLQQKKGGKQSQDGMDLSLAVVDKENKKMLFAGAKNPLYRVHNKEIEIIRGDINSIGGRAMRSKEGFDKTFNTKEVVFDKDSAYYFFSDGFMDQFGGPNEKKFNLDNFMNLLKECSVLDSISQRDKLHAAFDDWKGDFEQLDDVMILGVKFDA